MIPERVLREIDLLPHRPGCYQMYGADDTIIYVGKAKDLYNRVSQYFLRPQVGKVARMVRETCYFHFIITSSEKEAFILEINLIQEHYPRFNIMLKDGSHYPYIALKKGNDPIIKIARNRKDKNYTYFGPFPNSSAAYEMITLVNRLFPLRKCKSMHATRCIYESMGQCLAPCVKKVPAEVLRKLREDVSSFLQGDNKEVRRIYVDKMKKAADQLDFESAQEYKKIIQSIDHINQKQVMETKDTIARDVFAYSTREGYLALNVMIYRNGKLLGKDLFVVEVFEEIDEQIASMIAQFYRSHEIPREIVIPLENLAELMEESLKTKVFVPVRGMRYDLITTCQMNAKNGLDEHFLTARLDDDKNALLEELGTLCHIKTPYYIELFDNSHLQGAEPIGAMVAFINGEKVKKLYRKFHIEHAEARDDFASMREVIYRRYKRLKEEGGRLPDLILVDGGLGQIHAAKEALDAVEVDISLLGLFKNDKHQTEGLIDENGEVYPISNKSSLFYLLMRMQDEVHRFAITFHRSLHLKKYKSSVLDEIKGLGSKRKEALWKAYPSAADLYKAGREELSQILPPSLADLVYKKLHPEED